MFNTLISVAALAATLFAAAPALAQTCPSKPIKILVGFPPGGGLDITTRLIAPHLSEALGQPVVVENRAGAAGVLAHIEVARAAPDGYTLIVGNIGPLALAPNMMDKRPYDPVKVFTAIEQVVSTYFVVAVPTSHPANSLKAFVEWAKQNDGKVNFASGGNGSITHLNGELNPPDACALQRHRAGGHRSHRGADAHPHRHRLGAQATGHRWKAQSAGGDEPRPRPRTAGRAYRR